MDCSCPDGPSCASTSRPSSTAWARGSTTRPELLFLLRGVDGSDLSSRAVASAARLGEGGGGSLDAGEMEKLFGIEIDAEAAAGTGAGPVPVPEAPPRRRRPRTRTPAPAHTPARTRAAASGGAAARAARGRRRRAEEPLDLRVPALRDHFREVLSVTNASYRRLFAVEPLTATRELGELTARGLLVKLGTKRGTRYQPGPGLSRR